MLWVCDLCIGAALALAVFSVLPTTTQYDCHYCSSINWHCLFDTSTGLKTPGHLLGKNVCDVDPEWLSLDAGKL